MCKRSTKTPNGLYMLNISIFMVENLFLFFVLYTKKTPDITDSPHKNIILIFIILTLARQKGNKDICVQYCAVATQKYKYTKKKHFPRFHKTMVFMAANHNQEQ